MRSIDILFMIIVLLSVCCNKDRTSEKIHKDAQKYTILDVDNIKDIINIPIEIIIDKDPKYEKYLKYIPQKNEEIIGSIKNIVQGPDSTFYCSDYKKNIVSQFSCDGKYKGTICTTGSGPGECLKPAWMVNFKNKIYLNDHENFRMEILDLNGNYIREIKNFDQKFVRHFFIFDENRFMMCNDQYNDSPILILDSLGKISKKIGKNIVLGSNYSPMYHISHADILIAKKEGDDYFWFCYKDFPFIFKYDLNGNCLEEIMITGKFQNEKYEENKRTMILSKNSNQFSINYVIQDLQFFYGNLFISLTECGVIELNIRNGEIVKAVKLNFEHESKEYLNSFIMYCNIAVINSNFYCYSFNTIFRFLKQPD